jgi:DNA primase
MAKHYTADFLRMLRNQIPIDTVIVDLLYLEVRNGHRMLRFRCPLCHGFHTATNHETNLARCFDCQKNFNPIDLVMTVEKCSFFDAVEILKDKIDQ